MEKHYTVSKKKKTTKQNKQTNKKTPGTDCGSDHELLIKVWKITRPFRYDLNQIP